MIAQNVANILRDHVKLSVEGIDRMYLNVYVPRLQSEQGIVWFFRQHRGQPIPSAALMGPVACIRLAMVILLSASAFAMGAGAGAAGDGHVGGPGISELTSGTGSHGAAC